MDREALIIKIAREKYNYQGGGLDPEVRAAIIRTHAFPDDSGKNSDRLPGEDTLSYWERKRAEKTAAAHGAEQRAKQQAAGNQKSDSLLAKELFLQLQYDKLSREYDPTRRKFLEKQIAQAERELAEQVIAEDAAKTRADNAKALASNKLLQNAIENARACCNLLPDNEKEAARIRLYELENLSDPSEVETSLKRYWTETAEAESRVYQQMEVSDDRVEAFQAAAEATKAAVNLEAQRLEQLKRANDAQTNSEKENG